VDRGLEMQIQRFAVFAFGVAPELLSLFVLSPECGSDQRHDGQQENGNKGDAQPFKRYQWIHV
jgi:hypothetical protein